MKAIMEKKIVSQCPVCKSGLMVTQLSCPACQTQIGTQIPAPAFFQMPEDLQDFVLVFLRNRGNIRDVEKELGISYPTVCKKLDKVNEYLGNRKPAVNRLEILERLERGEITAKEAAQLLREA
ncbi:MAG: DUF2089 domain-containing protein [bacterium]